MKIPGISKRSGGAVTKLKAGKHIRYFLGTVAAVLVGFSVCIMVYFWFDQVMNGFLVDWFERSFVYDEWRPQADGGMAYSRDILWIELEKFVFAAALFLTTAWIISVRLISGLSASRREKETVRKIAMMIGNYMRRNAEAPEGFPEEYAEVSVQLTEIRSEMRLHEQILKQEAGRKNDLITYLAHDLKTPLTSVVGYLSLLDEAPDMPSAQKARYVHIALDKALRLEKLINEFFEITRYNLQQIVLEKETVDLEFMLVQMADEFYPVLQEHGNTVRLSLDGREWGAAGEAKNGEAIGEIPEVKGREAVGDTLQRGDRAGSREAGRPIQVYADAGKLARVFNNILKNAIAYSYPGTEIVIEVREAKQRVTEKAQAGTGAGAGKVTVAISNHGKTIPGQRLEAIFEKFFRLDESRATDSGGAGLGLAIAREIVTLHGGTITAQSENEVTVFTVELPGLKSTPFSAQNTCRK